MKVLIDTHIWIWMNSAPEKLSSKAKKTITRAKNDGIFMSVLSCFEVSKLHEKGKIKFAKPIQEWINEAIEYPSLSIIALTPSTCLKPTELNIKEINDPIDQMIIATAMDNQLPLITADKNIINFSKISTIW